MAESQNTCQWLQASIDWCEGRPEYAGVRRRVYYTSKQNIVAYPKFKRDGLGRVSSSILDGAFELKEGTYFHHFDIVPDRSQVTSDSQGEAPSQTSLDKATFVLPGVGPDESMLASYCHNSNNIYIFEDIHGRGHVIGCEEWPVKSTVAQDFGQGAAGNTATTLSIEATNRVPFPIVITPISTPEGEVRFVNPNIPDIVGQPG